jgi:hypothetical protein
MPAGHAAGDDIHAADDAQLPVLDQITRICSRPLNSAAAEPEISFDPYYSKQGLYCGGDCESYQKRANIKSSGELISEGYLLNGLSRYSGIERDAGRNAFG